MENKKNLRRNKIISYKNVGDKLSIVNNTCHLCKSIITIKDFHPCKNKILPSVNSKSKKNRGKNIKLYNKIFCMNCYEKYFPSYIVNSKFNMNLNCPSCEGLCMCKICAKNKEKQEIENENMILLGLKTNLNDSLNNNKNNKKPQKDKLNTKIERGEKYGKSWTKDDSEAKFNKEKNNKIIPLIEPNEFQIIKQYNLNLNKINKIWCILF